MNNTIDKLLLRMPAYRGDLDGLRGDWADHDPAMPAPVGPARER